MGEEIYGVATIFNFSVKDQFIIWGKYTVAVGKKGFSAKTLYKISEALSVSSDYIMLGEELDEHSKEKITCILEKMKPEQSSKIQDILKLLCEMCEVR